MRQAHPLMWAHYTTDGSGFVIGYDAAELGKLAGPVGVTVKGNKIAPWRRGGPWCSSVDIVQSIPTPASGPCNSD